MTTGNLELLAIAENLAREAGALARRRRAEGVQVAASKSSLVDVVTEADREVETLIRGRLAELRPSDAFFGEESGSGAGDSGLTWVVDPIDGTVNYLYGFPDYAVSIAVIEGPVDPLQWTPLAGTVYKPATEEAASAAAGHGATLAGVPIHAAAPTSFAEAMWGTGFSYDASMRELQAHVISKVIGRVRDIRRHGSAALDLVAAARGLLNVYGEAFLNPWDIAAGVLLVQEAGGAVEYLESGTPLGRLILAGEAGSVGHLRDRLVEVFAEL